MGSLTNVCLSQLNKTLIILPYLQENNKTQLLGHYGQVCLKHLKLTNKTNTSLYKYILTKTKSVSLFNMDLNLNQGGRERDFLKYLKIVSSE